MTSNRYTRSTAILSKGTLTEIPRFKRIEPPFEKPDAWYPWYIQLPVWSTVFACGFVVGWKLFMWMFG